MCGITHLRKIPGYELTEVELAKACGLQRHANNLRAHGQEVNGVVVLGAPLGSVEYIALFFKGKLARYTLDVQSIVRQSEQYGQAKVIQLMQGLRPHVIYAAQRAYVVAPRVVEAYVRDVQAVIDNAFLKLLKITPADMTDERRRVASLANGAELGHRPQA